MNAQSNLTVDSILSNWPLLVASLIITAAAFGLVGCKNDTLAKAAVQVATLKVIDSDVDRANRIVDIVSTTRTALSNESATTVDALVLIVKSKVDWSQLDAGDTILANLLIETVAEELEARLALVEDMDPIPWKLKADKVLSWVEHAAQMAR